MVPVGKSDATVGGRQPGVSLFLLGGNTYGPDIWGVLLGAVGCDNEDNGKYPCRVPMIDRGEADKMKCRKIMGDTGVQGGTMGGGYAVGGHIHRQ